MYTSKILLLVFILLTVWFGTVNLGKFIRREYISGSNTLIFALGVVGIIAYFI